MHRKSKTGENPQAVKDTQSTVENIYNNIVLSSHSNPKYIPKAISLKLCHTHNALPNKQNPKVKAKELWRQMFLSWDAYSMGYPAYNLGVANGSFLESIPLDLTGYSRVHKKCIKKMYILVPLFLGGTSKVSYFIKSIHKFNF